MDEQIQVQELPCEPALSSKRLQALVLVLGAGQCKEVTSHNFLIMQCDMQQNTKFVFPKCVFLENISGIYLFLCSLGCQCGSIRTRTYQKNKNTFFN